MATSNQKSFALEKAVELTEQALISTDKTNQIAHPEETAKYLETVYAKILELFDEKDS